ncbi:MAG: NUDIX domain-containing protein [Firmicutes bacterium]|nr:NUDIX domain-containing protein [Bacillota bacterium]
MENKLIVIVGPTCTFKSTVITKLQAANPKFKRVVTATTRTPREGEQNGVDYFFMSPQEFEKEKAAGGFLETEVVHAKAGHSYGTLAREVEKTLKAHYGVLDLGTTGALTLKGLMPEQVITIFLLPPDRDELIRRLKSRGPMSDQEIEARLASVPKEVEFAPLCDYRIDSITSDYITGEILKLLGLMGNSKFNLHEALKNYVPFDKKEAKHLESVLTFIEHGENLYDRSNAGGHITGSGFLMSADLSKTLLTHHSKLNKWIQFGGHCDGDENTMNVAARETWEESGIQTFEPVKNGIADIDVHIIPENKKKGESEHYHYDIRFIFSTNEEEFQISDESNELRWFTVEEFSQLDQSEDNQRFLKKWKAMQSELKRKNTDTK